MSFSFLVQCISCSFPSFSLFHVLLQQSKRESALVNSLKDRVAELELALLTQQQQHDEEIQRLRQVHKEEMEKAHELVEVRMRIKAERIDEGMDESREVGAEIDGDANADAGADAANDEGTDNVEDNNDGTVIRQRPNCNGAGAGAGGLHFHSHSRSLSTPSASRPMGVLAAHQLQLQRPEKLGDDQSGYTSGQIASWLKSRAASRASASRDAQR